MSCPTITEIKRTECIGNSLFTINDNFTALRDGTCDNDIQIESLGNNIKALNNIVLALSGITIPGSAKAWTKFDSTKDNRGFVNQYNTDRYLYNSYNVNSVYKVEEGYYRITFKTPFLDNSYTVVATCNETLVASNYVWVQPYEYAAEYVDIRIHTATSLTPANPSHVSLVVY
jgi:hypothetical protein